MSIKIGLYDFFAYTLPGGFYLFTIVYLCSILGLISLDFQGFANVSVIQALIFAAIAYVLGLLMDRIASVWYRRFKPKNLPQVVLDEFKAAHPDLDFKFQGRDWPILIAYLRRENIDLTPEIERFNVTHIMLKNIGFTCIVLAIIQAAQFVLTNFLIWHLIICIVFVVFSLIAGRQAARYNRWFYTANYEAIIAWGLEQSDLLASKPNPKQTS